MMKRVAKPLMVVLGQTGTGKTKLSVELCKAFNGEVISADSQQIYQGMDLATNKATTAEMEGVPHHMLSILAPNQLGFTIVNFRDQVLAILNDVWKRGKVPVICGGCTYYVENVLWNVMLEKAGSNDDLSMRFKAHSLPEDVLKMTTAEMYVRLQEVDKYTADITNPSDQRRILRALRIFYKHGQSWRKIAEKAGSHYNNSGEQEQQSGSQSGNDESCLDKEVLSEKDEAEKFQIAGPLRFPNTAVIWLRCEKETLERRTNKRVDDMERLGLKKETSEFYDAFYGNYLKQVAEHEQMIKSASNLPDEGDDGAEKTNFQHGLFQSIGIKEFLSFLQLPPSERASEWGDALWEEGLERMKLKTRQYANYQRRWIQKRLVERGDRQQPPYYQLNTDNYPEGWTEEVHKPAMHIMECLLKGEPTTDIQPLTGARRSVAEDIEAKMVHYCALCKKHISGMKSWEAHIGGRPHRYAKNRLRKNNTKQLRRILKARERQLEEEEETAAEGDECSPTSSKKTDKDLLQRRATSLICNEDPQEESSSMSEKTVGGEQDCDSGEKEKLSESTLNVEDDLSTNLLFDQHQASLNR